MGKHLFYGQWLRRAILSGSLSKGDFISSVAGGIVTVASHFLSPIHAHSLAEWGWHIPVVGLAAAMALRLLAAPYEMWREQKERADALPPEQRPFDVSLWDEVNQFLIYQAACLWIEKSPPASVDRDIPYAAIVALQRIKEGLARVAKRRQFEAAGPGNEWVIPFLMALIGPKKEEINNSLLVDRGTLKECAKELGERPRFLFAEND